MGSNGKLKAVDQVEGDYELRMREEIGDMGLDQLIETMEVATQKTMVITDYRCIEHADFPNKRHIKEKVAQREKQPENSDRLSLLVDSKIGLFTNGVEFSQKKKPSLILKQGVNEFAKIADILKIHDFNYI